jgi:hypothetical protein
MYFIFNLYFNTKRETSGQNAFFMKSNLKDQKNLFKAWNHDLCYVFDRKRSPDDPWDSLDPYYERNFGFGDAITNGLMFIYNTHRIISRPNRTSFGGNQMAFFLYGVLSTVTPKNDFQDFTQRSNKTPPKSIAFAAWDVNEMTSFEIQSSLVFRQFMQNGVFKRDVFFTSHVFLKNSEQLPDIPLENRHITFGTMVFKKKHTSQGESSVKTKELVKYSTWSDFPLLGPIRFYDPAKLGNAVIWIDEWNSIALQLITRNGNLVISDKVVDHLKKSLENLKSRLLTKGNTSASGSPNKRGSGKSPAKTPKSPAKPTLSRRKLKTSVLQKNNTGLSIYDTNKSTQVGGRIFGKKNSASKKETWEIKLENNPLWFFDDDDYKYDFISKVPPEKRFSRRVEVFRTDGSTGERYLDYHNTWGSVFWEVPRSVTSSWFADHRNSQLSFEAPNKLRTRNVGIHPREGNIVVKYEVDRALEVFSRTKNGELPFLASLLNVVRSAATREVILSEESERLANDMCNEILGILVVRSSRSNNQETSTRDNEIGILEPDIFAFYSRFEFRRKDYDVVNRSGETVRFTNLDAFEMHEVYWEYEEVRKNIASARFVEISNHFRTTYPHVSLLIACEMFDEFFAKPWDEAESWEVLDEVLSGANVPGAPFVCKKGSKATLKYDMRTMDGVHYSVVSPPMTRLWAQKFYVVLKRRLFGDVKYGFRMTRLEKGHNGFYRYELHVTDLGSFFYNLDWSALQWLRMSRRDYVDYFKRRDDDIPETVKSSETPVLYDYLIPSSFEIRTKNLYMRKNLTVIRAEEPAIERETEKRNRAVPRMLAIGKRYADGYDYRNDPNVRVFDPFANVKNFVLEYANAKNKEERIKTKEKYIENPILISNGGVVFMQG